MNDLKVAIIGCGARGKGHAAVWKTTPGAEIAAVCDIDTQRLKALAEDTGAAPYEDWRQAVLHEGVNAVTQAVPSHLHCEVTCLAAEHGRHVFGEKPLALTLEQGQRMAAAVKKHGIVFMPCFQNRDGTAFNKYREVVRSGAAGGPVMLRFSDIREVRPKTAMHRESENGGVVIDMACHIFDIMRYITGEEPRTIFATGNVYGRGKARLEGIEDLAVDEAGIEAVYGGGHRLQMYLNWGMPENFPGIGEPHMLIGPELAMRAAGKDVEVIYADHRETWPGPDRPQDRRIERFCAAVRGETETDITVDDGLIALRCSHAALESARTGRVVAL
ncbi:MAG: Gfo/Idh/MocA family oxidoreductase [Lentisphaerae bacterium]|nr:Gfo/Idh/MocA family oxidoreductase [Lentisphaerota bacterium]